MYNGKNFVPKMPTNIYSRLMGKVIGFNGNKKQSNPIFINLNATRFELYLQPKLIPKIDSWAFGRVTSKQKPVQGINSCGSQGIRLKRFCLPRGGRSS
jgi:hypothetical protein